MFARLAAMVAAPRALPDLNQLDPTALKALILSQHEQLLSRDNEIEHLKHRADASSIIGAWYLSTESTLVKKVYCYFRRSGRTVAYRDH
jgi:hypothetical protein